MELLDPTLKELENAGGLLGSLNNHYVRDIYPQFKEDFSDLGIADIDVYENYNLQNVLDDLRHIQFLLSGSPRKDQFRKKVEFLVQLSQKTLKNAKSSSYEPKDYTTKKLEFGPLSDIYSMKENREKTKREKNVLPPLVVRSLDQKPKEPKKKEEVIKIQKVSPKKTREVLKEKKEVKKKKSFLDTKPLTRIYEEEAVEEDASGPDSPIHPSHMAYLNGKTEEDHIDWNLSSEQHEIVQNTLKKYDMSEDVWKNYILTKVHGDAQLRRLGITVPSQKVDAQMETMRFVEELERHMSRKARTTARKSKANAIFLKPLQADAVTKPPEFKHSDLFTNPLIDLNSSQSAKSKTLTSLDQPPLLKKLMPSTTTAVIRDEPTKIFSDGQGSSTQDLTNMPINLPLGVFKGKGIGSKTWTMGTLHSQMIPSQVNSEEGQALDLNDSLRESLQMDPVSFYNYLKSQAQYHLNSVSSFNSHPKKFSHLQGLDTVVSNRPTSGRKYKHIKGHSLNSLTDMQQEAQLNDSLEGDSLVIGNGYSNGGKNHFRISNVRTIKSKYLSSCNEVKDVNGQTLELNPNKCETLESKDIKSEKINISDELRSDLSSAQSESIASESLNDRTTIQSASIKSLVTICSQNESMMRIGLSQVGKVDNVSEVEYCGKVKRICLLGSGSEAKVFLCRTKEFDHDVALKQYDLVKNQKGNVDTYQSLGKEFEMLKHLKHENIIQYHCLYKPQKMKFTNCIEFGIIMEYMPGGSLDTYIEENYKTMSLETKKSIMKQIISGLNFLHEHHIIHRDLKPGNILLSTDKKKVKISDFGISKKTDNDTNTRRTLVGTPWYMAPEVINQEGYSSKADIWSVGCCFFHLITGEKPYSKANAIQALLLMVNHKSPLEACNPEILEKINEHEGVKEFLELCFSRNQSIRPTASMLLQHPIFKDTQLA